MVRGVVLFWFALGSAISLLYMATTRLTSDQGQMLVRGVRLAFDGEWTHYGNLVTGGGYVPGSLITAVTGIPLLIWDSPMAPQILVLLLHLWGFWLLNQALKGEVSDEIRKWILVLAWLTPWHLSKVILWNPSYLFFFAALHFWSCKKLSESRSFWASLCLVLSIGLAAQFHASFVILVVMSGWQWWRQRLMVRWTGLALGMVMVGLSLIPFIMALKAQPELLPVAKGGSHFYGRGLLLVFPFVKGVLYWPKYLSMAFPSFIYNDFRLDSGFAQAILGRVVGFRTGGLSEEAADIDVVTCKGRQQDSQKTVVVVSMTGNLRRRNGHPGHLLRCVPRHGGAQIGRALLDRALLVVPTSRVRRRDRRLDLEVEDQLVAIPTLIALPGKVFPQVETLVLLRKVAVRRTRGFVDSGPAHQLVRCALISSKSETRTAPFSRYLRGHVSSRLRKQLSRMNNFRPC